MYRMAGIEDKIGQSGITYDGTEGIIPRSFKYLWDAMQARNEQFYIKASFLEIYNEQIIDLLNPSSGILHTRWNPKNVSFIKMEIIINRDSLLKIRCLWSVAILMISLQCYMKE